MENEKLYAAMQEAMVNLQPFYRDAMTQAIEETGLETPAWFTLVQVNGLNEPVTLDQFQALSPFALVEGLKERIQPGLDKGYLETDPNTKGYRLTKTGLNAAMRPFEIAHKEMDEAQPIALEKLNRLAELLGRIIDSTLEAKKPAHKLNLKRSRTTHPKHDAGPVTLIDQYITDLIAYRDDAHNGAWLPHGCSAQTWDVLTSVWRKQSEDLDGLVEQFEARGYSRESLGAAIQEAEGLGWIKSSDGKLKMTEAGAALRQDTEDLTNEYFFAPWSSLSADERKEFEDLFVAYNTAIKPAEEPIEAD